MSNAVAKSKIIAIQYSRSTCVLYIYSIIFIYFLVDWHFFEKSIILYNGLMYCTLNNLIFICFIFLLSFLILTLTSFYPSQVNNITKSNYGKTNTESNGSLEKELVINLSEKNESAKFNVKNLLQTNREHYKIIEYPLIAQFILIGGIALLSSNDLITIFLAIELQSYGLYILSTIYRNSESSTSAGLTYFLLGGLSSCIILLGQSFLYINFGTTNLDGIYLVHNIITSNDNLFYFIKESAVDYMFYMPTLNFYHYALQFSLIILSVGFLFKISAAPFHSWSPGVYDAIPTVTTTFVAIIPKISILILFFDLVYSTWYTLFNFSWTNILLFSSFLSLIIGSVLGLTQFRIKRLYAYSTISHVGFILLALCVHSAESIQAFYFYIVQYSLSNLNAFVILIAIGYTYINYSEKTKTYNTISSIYDELTRKINNLSPIEYIDQLKGYFYLNPMLAISLSITLYSFIGIPPLVGFFAKQMILSSALDNGNLFMCLIAILTSVVSAVYYLYIIKHMFFEKSKFIKNISLPYGVVKNSNKKITLSNWLTILISILTLLIFLFIFSYSEIYFLMNILSILNIY